ncbi:MAG: ABC transporter permease [Candidatus Limiplasma sp.]|nr:ABC transporter permease [Candidatus Limiplasma sp.]
MRRLFKRTYLTLILLFLYTPIVVLIVQSFNAGKSRAKWEGFSLRWYSALFQDQSIMRALYVTLSVAVIAAIVATVLGTLAAIGIHAMRKRPQALMMTMTNLPMTMPDIVTGISLMILFTFSKIERGYVTMLLAHITFNTPYVILSVLPKLKQMNKHTYEAALDLGATPTYALLHVILPEISPGVVTGCLLAFTLSLDDFVISYFTTSPMVQNLSTLIYSMARIGIEPTLNALSALMFLALLALLLIVNKRASRPAKLQA